MLDSKSLDTISQLKSALLMRSHSGKTTELASGNRGKKMVKADDKINTLTPKIVEYNGTNQLVLTNDVIERTNYHNKRRWSDFYRDSAEKGNYRAGADDAESDADSSDSDFSDSENPFKSIRLSEILAPLYHPSELYTHPAISKTFKSGCLSTLAAELIEVIEGEQKTLNHFNKLLQVLDGEDWFYQLEENMELPQYDHGLDESSKENGLDGEKKSVEGSSSNGENGESRAENGEKNGEYGNGEKNEEKDGEKDGNGEKTAENGNGADALKKEAEADGRRITRNARLQAEPIVTDPFFALPKSLEIFERQQQRQLEETEDDDELVAIQQELINYLQVSIQRQHEYIKNLSTIRAGLVKADKYKKELYRWGREMSEKK